MPSDLRPGLVVRYGDFNCACRWELIDIEIRVWDAYCIATCFYHDYLVGNRYLLGAAAIVYDPLAEALGELFDSPGPIEATASDKL